MSKSHPGRQEGANAEIVSMIEESLERLRRLEPPRHRAIGHLEAAIKCLQDSRKHLRPAELNSSNDG